MQKYETCFRNRSRKCQIFHAVIKCYKNVTFYCLFIVLQIKFAMGAYGRTWAHFSTFAKMRPGRILFLVYSHSAKMRPWAHFSTFDKMRPCAKTRPWAHFSAFDKMRPQRVWAHWAHMGAYGRIWAQFSSSLFNKLCGKSV